MSHHLPIQERLFEKISASLSPHLSLADAVKDALGIGDTSVHRRLNGDTTLRIDEVHTLCATFGISFDELAQTQSGNRPLLFHALGLRPTEVNLDKYLLSIRHMIQSFRGGSQYIYAAKDVPAFHIFQYPELTAF